MQRFKYLSLAMLLLLGCGTNNRPNKSALKTNNLKSTFITLSANAAYTLKTPKGAVIKIAAQSFGNLTGKIQLEIKEAYTLQDILLAGLTTESNGKLLNSGGMFYINATQDDNPISLLKPIKIEIPATVYDDKMQLFKGEVNEDSSINWVDPQTIDTGLTAKKLQRGAELFKSDCASCHKPTMDFTGPALAHCRDREPDKDWVYKFVYNVNSMLNNDSYAKRLMNLYRSAMPQTRLSKEDIKAILDYCDAKAGLTPYVEPAYLSDSTSAKPSVKPCGLDTVYYAKPDTSIKILPVDTTIVADTATQNIITTQTTTRSTPLDFTDHSYTSGMYDISIQAFGWYNLDVFIDAYDGLTNVKVQVQLQLPVENQMDVFLFCPDKRLLTQATKGNGNSYVFEKENGFIPLFLKDKAVVLAFGSKNEKMYYGTATFNIKTTQIINIAIKETTEEKLKSFIKENNIDDIKIDLNKKDDFEVRQKPCDGEKRDSTRTVL